MMVPLSTRNVKQRDGLAMLTNMALSIIPGMFVALFFPMLIIPALGVDQSKWLGMIVVFSIIALPCVMLEYFFTKERITEEETEETSENQALSVLQQLKICLHDKYWVMIMAMIIVIQVVTNLQNTGLVYYCNWVLGTYSDGTTQTIVSAVGNAPLGFGILIMWPLVGKFGKRKVMLAGTAIAAVFGLAFLANPTNMAYVLVMLIVRAFGALPVTYITMALLADALDHVEWKAGRRLDGFSMSIYTIIFTVSAGLATSLFNLGLSLTGYIPPADDGSWVVQSQSVQTFFCWSYQGFAAIGMIFVFIVMLFYKVEDDIPRIHQEVTARHKAEAAAAGKEWFSAEEIAAKEQEEQDRLAEENRIRELKEKCEKKGLNFDEEEAKYQAALAAKKAKEVEKAAKKQAKAEEKAAGKRKN